MTRYAALLAALALPALVALPAAAQTISAYVSAAVNDSSRPAADKARDADRKPAESVAFAGVKPGDIVLELLGSGGYYTRILSKVVGPTGHVYSTAPAAPASGVAMGGGSMAGGNAMAGRGAMGDGGMGGGGRAMGAGRGMMGGGGLAAITADPAYNNVTMLSQPIGAPSAPIPVDVVWTSDNYHDLHNPGRMGAGDMTAFNRAVFAALKPGGTYIVIDHAAAAGSGISATGTLHRIDPAAAKAEIVAAGFAFVGQSDALHRPNDDHTARSNDADDQFIFRFRKP